MKLTAFALIAFVGLSFTTDLLTKTDDPINELAAKTADSDNYRVIKVNGRILYIRNGKDMLTGDIFSPKERLNFKTDDSRAAVISKIAGRKILSPKSGDISAFCRSLFVEYQATVLDALLLDILK